MTGLTRRSVTAGALALAAAPAVAQPQIGPAGPGLFETGAASHDIRRLAFVSKDGQRRYRVDVATPKAAAAKAGRPVLYLLDGGAAFTDLTAADLAATPGLAVVAVGYDTPLRFDVSARAYDYTPPSPEGAAIVEEASPDRRAGGADIFLDLLADAVMPAVEAKLDVDPRRRTLWGHSYGGLFVLNALYKRPDLFSIFVAASPSLWWRQGEAFAALPKPPARPTRVQLIVGGAERGRAVAGRPAPPPGQTVEAVQALGRRLSAVANLSVAVEVLPGLGHGEVFTQSLPRALRLAAA